MEKERMPVIKVVHHTSPSLDGSIHHSWQAQAHGVNDAGPWEKLAPVRDDREMALEDVGVLSGVVRRELKNSEPPPPEE